MKNIHYFYMGLFCLIVAGIFYDSSVFSIVEEKPLEEWKPKELTDITSKEEADNLEREKKNELTKAQEEEKKSATDQEKKQAALNVDRVHYDLKTITMAKIANKWGDYAIFTPEQITQSFRSVKLDREAVDTRIQAYSADLNVAYEPLVKVESSSQYTTYYQTVKNEIVKEFSYDEKVNILNSFDAAAREIKDYKQQRDMLVQLHDVVTTEEKFVGFEYKTELQSLAARVGDRIAQIDTFFTPENIAQRQSFANQTAQNSVAVRLKLNEKIPDDQIVAVKNEFETLLDVTMNHLKKLSKNVDVFLRDVDQLEQLRGAMKVYGVDTRDEKFTLSLDDMIKIVRDAKKALETPVVTQEKPKGYWDSWKSSIQQVASGAMSVVGTVGTVFTEYAAFTVRDIYNGVQAIRQSSGESLKSVGEVLVGASERIQNVADSMNNSPDIAAQTLSGVADAYEKLKTKETTAYILSWVPADFAQNAANALMKAQEITGKILINQEVIQNFAAKVQDIAPSLVKVADVVKNAGDGLVSLAEKISSQQAQDPKEQAAIAKKVTELQKAQAYINTYKIEVNLNDIAKSSKFQTMVQSVKDIVKTISDSIRKKVFDPYGDKRQRAIDTYDTAQKDYLASLGFTEKEILAKTPTAEEIRSKWQNASPETKDILQKKAQAFAKATTDLSDVYKTFMDQLSAARANFEFVVNAFEPYIESSQVPPDDIVKVVNDIFDARDGKLAYLQAVDSGLRSLQEAVQSMNFGESASAVSSELFDPLTAIINSKMLSEIGTWYDTANSLNGKINAVLDAYKKSSLKKQQDIPG